MDDININPIGIVKSEILDTSSMTIANNKKSEINIFKPFLKGLNRINEHSHLWVITWLHLANKNILVTVPGKVNPLLPEFGVFGLRSPGRPNPIGLSLVKLDKVRGESIYVRGLDAISGTPVIDIKPYMESDIIFSPITPYIPPWKKEIVLNKLYKQALSHHQEECGGLLLAIRMAVMAQEEFGHLNAPDLKVFVQGSPCLADTLQGLTRARLANPPRFKFEETKVKNKSIWQQGSRELHLEAQVEIDQLNFDNPDISSILTIKKIEIKY